MRTRLAWVALAFIVASALAYNVREQLVSVVLSPIGHQKLVYLTPAGGFAFIFQVSMYAGMLATAPIAAYHLYRFISPALPPHMRRLGIRIVLFSTLLLIAGVSFGYFVAIPAALQFLMNFGGEFVTANLTAESYLSFVVAYLLGLGLLFQLPLLLILWNWIRPFKPGELLATQRFVLVGAFIAAALITPTPDVMNQCLIAVPIIAIYQAGVVAVFVMNKRRRQRASRLDKRRLRAQQASEAFRQGSAQPLPLQTPVAPPTSAVLQPEPVPYVPVPAPAPRPSRSVDGFTRVRANTLGVPVRSSPVVQPRANSVVRPVRPPARRRQASVDGFGFIS
jgi:sec-independent protein translocase protein TatC